MREDMVGKKTYFGLKVINHQGVIGVLKSDIKKLPFYEFWCEKSIGSTHGGIEDENGNLIESIIYLHDWEKFCRIFINSGR
ncbi:hypothetical protein [Campylobacter suis]|uniref:Uncharacterized protein n=1 Tax=Campylobacter suis TaxID=2790657 RepID=A0ABM8Q823_9BACT|nr:hypothetical protein [Campylobacter suis]CAD7289038.1 hypothetical protein LMG8286_01623 [Campylobacter suis]